MSEELRVLDRWIALGFFNETTNLETEIEIAKIADKFFTELVDEVDGLPIRLLSMVAAVKIFKIFNMSPTVEEVYNEIVEFNNIKPFTEENGREWMNDFINNYKENKQINA